MKHLQPWLNQTFMGRPAKIGEDRAITNLVLQGGYHVTFQVVDQSLYPDDGPQRQVAHTGHGSRQTVPRPGQTPPHSLDESTCRIVYLGRGRSARDRDEDPAWKKSPTKIIVPDFFGKRQIGVHYLISGLNSEG